MAADVSPPPAVAQGIIPFVGNVAQAAEVVIDSSLSGGGGHVCLLNVHLFVSALHDTQLMEAVQTATLVFPDGSPIAWLQRRLGAASAQRVPGPELMPAVISAGRRRGLRHFLYGSTPSVIEALERRLERSYPGVKIVGSCSPPFTLQTASDEHADIERIRRTSPDIVWCALGSPKQELWASRSAPAIAPALVVAVGAAFDFLSENKPRAPRAWQRLGIEWLYRLATEPRRLAWRYVRTNPEFAAVALRELVRRRARS